LDLSPRSPGLLIKMKHNPIHENLDTSFINLSALVRYLRRRQFVGKVRIELSGYEADIYLCKGNQLRAREYDRITGRISEGEEALQRILIRAREAGGTVNVYQEVVEKIDEPKLPAKNEDQSETKPIQDIKPVTVVAQQQPTNGKPNGAISSDITKPKTALPDFPFELSNNVENKARQAKLSPTEWQRLLDLMSELLETVDKTLAAANLDFTAALNKARAQVSSDYPFLNPDSNIFVYKNGKIAMREQASPKLFVASIVEILQRILDKLGSIPKFSPAYRLATKNILTLIQHRKPIYDKFSITEQLKKVV
jgi:hypothetical protein